MIDAYKTLKAIRASWWISSDLPTNVILDKSNKFIGVVTLNLPANLHAWKFSSTKENPDDRAVYIELVDNFVWRVYREENCTICDVNSFWPITRPVPSWLMFNIIQIEIKRRTLEDLKALKFLCGRLS